MVGPGEVDEELEPEVKEECEGKYGEIIKVKIKEMPGVVEEEAVRIFLEFKRQECAIKGKSGKIYLCKFYIQYAFQPLLTSMADFLAEEKFALHSITLKIFKMTILLNSS